MGIFTDLIYKEKRQTEADFTKSKFVRKLDKDNGEFILECGHTKTTSFRNMKAGTFTCIECRECAIKQEALDKEVICLDEHPCGTYNNYYFPECGHTRKMARCNVKSSVDKLQCSLCFNEMLLRGAIKNNLTILDVKSKTSHRICKFACCGLEKAVAVESLRGTVRCPICYRKCIDEDVENTSGLKINKSKKEHIRHHRYFILPCGHEKHMSIQNAIIGSYSCRECGKSKLDLPSRLYLIKVESMGYEWLKFGYGHSISKRIKEYGLIDGAKTEVICDIIVETGEQARDYEKAVHSKYKSLKLDKSLMRNYMRIGGFSECYPMSAKDTLIRELNSCPFK